MKKQKIWHQYNILSKKENDEVIVSGAIQYSSKENRCEATKQEYLSDAIPEIITEHSSEAFIKVLTGKNGRDAFALLHDEAYPEWLNKPAQADLLDEFTRNGRNHVVCYSILDLITKLKVCAQRISEYIRIRSGQDPDYIRFGKINDETMLLEEVQRLHSKLTHQIESSWLGINWSMSYICFNFGV